MPHALSFLGRADALTSQPPTTTRDAMLALRRPCVLIALASGGGLIVGRGLTGQGLELLHWRVLGFSTWMVASAWLILWPLLMRIDVPDWRSLQAWRRPLGLTLAVAWIVKPALALLLTAPTQLGLHAAGIAAGAAADYASSLMLLSLAPSTAAVVAWVWLAGADAGFALAAIIVADALLLLVAAPLLGMLLGLSALAISVDSLSCSIAVYLLLPLLGSRLLRLGLGLGRVSGAEQRRQLDALGALTVPGVMLLCGFLSAHAGHCLRPLPPQIWLLAVPLAAKALGSAAIAVVVARRLGLDYAVAQGVALVGASSFLPFAHALAVSLGGADSAFGHGVEVGFVAEAPLLLLLVVALRALRPWYAAPTRKPA